MYIYTEATAPRQPRDKAQISLTRSSGTSCMHFYYHMYGEDTGELNLYHYNTWTRRRRLLWSRSGPQGKEWLESRKIKLKAGKYQVYEALHIHRDDVIRMARWAKTSYVFHFFKLISLQNERWPPFLILYISINPKDFIPSVFPKQNDIYLSHRKATFPASSRPARMTKKKVEGIGVYGRKEQCFYFQCMFMLQ